MLGWIFWDPSSEFVIIPFVNIPITWYGLLFAIGFWLGFHMFTFMLKNRLGAKDANIFSERLLLYIIVATIIGARLGHIIFYENLGEYLAHPISIFKTWEGGLASHGAVLAIVIAVIIFSIRIRKEFPEFTFWKILDYLAVPAMLLSTLIRIGNFFNQEILGTSTDKPWGIIFGHPADGGLLTPRHPAQLYEAAFYFSLFLLLAHLWYRKRDELLSGRLAGITLVSAFLFRFLIEFIKTEQSAWFDRPDGSLLMGQVLSLPIIALGLYLLMRKGKITTQVI